MHVAGPLKGTNSVHSHTHTRGRLGPPQPDVHIMSVGVRNPNGFQSAFSATQNPLEKLISEVISVETHQGFLFFFYKIPGN